MASTMAMVTVLRDDDRERFTQILAESFPVNERDDPEQVLANIEDGRRHCWVAYEGEALVAFAVLLDLPAVNSVLLEYLAVANHVRSRGIGGHLLDDVLAELVSGSTPPAGVVLEVEPPDVVHGAERAIRQRRIAFYERHGATVVANAPRYRVPSTTGPEMLPFLLMWRALARLGPLGVEQLPRIVEAVLVEGHDVPVGDPSIQSVLADLVT